MFLINSQKSHFFITNKGVRQGEKLSTLLFALFVNDIEDHLLANGCKYVNIDNEALGNYIKLLVRMCADDTIIITDNEENLEKVITCIEIYCGRWNLIVNESETKIIIFGKTKVKTNFKFIYNEVELELVEHFKYLGLIVNFNGSFKLAITGLNKQTSRVMYALIGKCRKLGLPIDLQIELFDRILVPIILYGVGTRKLHRN